MILILNDASTINFDHDNGLSDVVAVGYLTLEAANADVAKLTPRNLSNVRITTDGGDPVAVYENGLILDSTEIVPNVGADEETVNDYDLHIHMHDKTAVEILTERVDALEESQEVQDGAIDDLGEAVSGLYE